MTEPTSLPARDNTQEVCSGCGAPLQSVHEQAPGYLPVAARDRAQPVCRRCFRIRHYGEFSPVAVGPEAYAREVARISRQPGLVLYLLDAFDLQGSLIPALSRYIGAAPVQAVVNKADLLPTDLATPSFSQWVRRALAATGVQVQGVRLVSGRTGQGVAQLAEWLEHSGISRVYAVGMANVGKSTLLNRLLHRWTERSPLTESKVPGTTLGTVALDVTLPSGRRLTVIDTPGLMRMRRAVDVLCPRCLKAAVPDDPLHPRVYQLDPGQSLWLGGFARLDFVAGEHQPVVVYVSNRLVVHRTKLSRAEVIGQDRADEVLRVPCAACRVRLGELQPQTVGAGRYRGTPQAGPVWSVGAKGADLVLAGLGWLTLQGKDFSGRLWTPATIEVAVRPRLLGQLTHRL
ncbi:MAG: 50S ribosome-binding GTPase [Alicyclobacillus sp.]|nr:50S ribosome-binding GTPase [Alicyclobacillus sp.]